MENTVETVDCVQLDLPDTPYPLLQEWLELAEQSEPNDPNVMCLATADQNGKPSARMILLKGLDERGLVFYTNTQSRKGEQLENNQNAAVCFHWKSLRKQVRVEGCIEEVSSEEANAYYKSRSRGSRIGAWASKQSSALENMEQLKNSVAAYEDKFDDVEDIPRPPHWRGFRIIPDYFEFWVDGQYRLHQRYLYTRDEDGNWQTGMLYP